MTLAYRRDLLKLGMIATAGLLFSSFDQAAFAEETGSALTLPGGKGPCSGLPWFSGGFKNPDLFAGWRGRPLDVYTSFVAFDTWAAMLAFPGNTTFPAYSRKPVWLSLAYPLLPKTWGDTPFLSMWDECAEFDPARQTPAASLFWARHLQILDNIAAALQGPRTLCLGLVLRVGWEFDDPSSYWKLTNYGKAAQYRAVFQRLAEEARSRMPRVVIEWNPLRKGNEGAYFGDVWPGDGYVDIVSICHYDRMPSFDTQAIWDSYASRRNVKTKLVYNPKRRRNDILTLYDNPWGIETWAAFARDHGKKFAVPEWALTNGWTSTDNCKDRDNPLFIELMMKFFNDHADILAYESYFNSSTKHMLYPPGEVAYAPALETNSSNAPCRTPSLNWPTVDGGRLTSVNDRAAQRYKDLIQYYYEQANPVA